MVREGRIIDVMPNGDAPFEDDVEQAFDEWRKGFEDSESPVTIRAFRIPLDEQGRASHSASGQIRLGTWPVDQYDFDTLCDKLKREFMPPGDTLMAVRLIGTLTGKAGVRFNKIVTLQRPNSIDPPGTVPKDGMAEIMRSMQDSNERMMRLFQEMRGPGANDASAGGNQSMMQTIAMMRVLMEPTTQMMGPMLAALAGRPLPPAAPGGSMKELIETMMLMDKFMGRRGGGGSDEPDWMKLTTAVTGVAKPLLEMAAARSMEGTRTRKSLTAPVQPAPPAPVQPAPFQPGAPTTAAPTPVTPASVRPVAPSSGVDLSRPSPLPAGSLAQGANIEAPSSQLPQGDSSMFAEYKKQVDALVDVARNGADPVAVANAFFEQTMMELNDADYGRLAAIVENESFVSTIGIYNAQVKEYGSFFADLRAQLIKRIAEEDPGQ
jgi:hypothetical protein